MTRTGKWNGIQDDPTGQRRCKFDIPATNPSSKTMTITQGLIAQRSKPRSQAVLEIPSASDQFVQKSSRRRIHSWSNGKPWKVKLATPTSQDRLGFLESSEARVLKKYLKQNQLLPNISSARAREYLTVLGRQDLASQDTFISLAQLGKAFSANDKSRKV
jgi:hypothetical protein